MLPSQDGFDVAGAYVDGVVAHYFEVAHLLEGEMQFIACVAACQTTGPGVSFRVVHHAGSKLEIGGVDAGITPGGVSAEGELCRAFPEAGVGDQSVGLVIIGAGIAVRETGLPYPAAVVAADGEGIGEESAVGLALRLHAAADGARHGERFRAEDNHSCKGVGTPEKGSRPFQDFYGMDAESVRLQTVFVAPLLPFLPDAVRHHYHAVVAEAPDDGFCDAAARGDGAQAGFTRNGIDNVGGCAGLQLRRGNHGNRGGCLFDAGVSRHACNDHFSQLQVPEKDVGGIRLLCTCRHAYA